MPVLIITERDDIHGTALIWALEKLGVRCDRWSISDLPERQLSSIRLSNSLPDPPLCKVPGLLPSPSYTSIWMRRLALPETISTELADADVEMAKLHARRFSEGLRTVISPGSTWINPCRTRLFSTSKPYQLQTAKRVGFAIPETLFSNDPNDIRDFYRAQRGNVIYKAFAPAFWSETSAGRVRAVFTSRVTEDLLSEDDVSLTSCPGIYQEYIDKKAELRITFFGSAYQAARIYSQEVAAGKIDFRSDMKGEARMEVASLNTSVLDKCRAFSKALGLLHGSFDLIERPDGTVVFLEINEMGQFLWLEERLPEMPMLAMFAAFSLDPSPDFVLDSKRRVLTSFHDFLSSEAYVAFRKELGDNSISQQAKSFCYVE